jgi:DNA-binding transcriptional ArsR family regulator
MFERAALVAALPEKARREAVHFLEELGACVYDTGCDIGKDAAILLAHRFLELSEKVTELKNDFNQYA